MSGICKLIILHLTENNQVFIRVNNWLTGATRLNENALIVKQKSEISHLLYPDHMVEVTMRIFTHTNPPLVTVDNGKIKSKYMYFFKILKERRILTRIRVLSLSDPRQISSRFKEWQANRQYELFLSKTFNFIDNLPRLMTYEQLSYCVMVPKPERTSIIQFIFLQPFDWITWILLIIFTFLAMIFLKILKSSQMRFLSAILANLVGQAVEFRHNRITLTFLLQFFIFATFQLSILYDAEITSAITERFEERRYSTFNDIIDSDEKFNFVMTSSFAKHLIDSEKFENIRDRVKYSISLNYSPKEIAEKKIVIIAMCDVAELHLSNLSNFYYVLPEKILPHYLQFDVALINPFLEKLQSIMNYAFEGGLPQAWEKLEKFSLNNDGLTEEFGEFESEQPLKLEELIQVFLILPVGLSLSLLVFLCEILYYKCQHISWTWIKIVISRKLVRFKGEIFENIKTVKNIRKRTIRPEN